MRRERERDLVEHARTEEIDLSAAVLLRRRADELERHAEIVFRGRVQEGADVRHGDEVVTAAVTDACQCVVFRDQRDRRSG